MSVSLIRQDFASSIGTAGKIIENIAIQERKMLYGTFKNMYLKKKKTEERLVPAKWFILAPKEVNPQDKVNENITLLILKHDKDTLIDEVNSLKLVIQSIAVQLVNKEQQQKVMTREEQIFMFKQYFKNKITLKKHMYMKLKVHNQDKCSTQLKKINEMLWSMAECQEKGNKDKLYLKQLQNTKDNYPKKKIIEIYIYLYFFYPSCCQIGP